MAVGWRIGDPPQLKNMTESTQANNGFWDSLLDLGGGIIKSKLGADAAADQRKAAQANQKKASILSTLQSKQALIIGGVVAAVIVVFLIFRRS